MAKYDDYICVLRDNDLFCLCVVDNTVEKIIKTILVNDGTLFSYVGFIEVSADMNTCYVVDINKGCYGITLDSHVIFHYHYSTAQCYLGLVVDSEGLFIGSEVK